MLVFRCFRLVASTTGVPHVSETQDPRSVTVAPGVARQEFEKEKVSG